MQNKDNIHNDTDVEIERDIDGETAHETEIDESEGHMKLLITSLKKKLKECEEEKRSNLEEMQRIRADFLNSKRRLEEQLERDRERAIDTVLRELLTLYDSFDTAMANKEVWERIDATWRIGVEAMHTKLLSIFTSYNVTSIDPLGAHFNPHEHEAISNQTTVDDAQVDIVLAVMQKGFKRGDHIIRPARVVVGSK